MPGAMIWSYGIKIAFLPIIASLNLYYSAHAGALELQKLHL